MCRYRCFLLLFYSGVSILRCKQRKTPARVLFLLLLTPSSLWWALRHLLWRASQRQRAIYNLAAKGKPASSQIHVPAPVLLRNRASDHRWVFWQLIEPVLKDLRVQNMQSLQRYSKILIRRCFYFYLNSLFLVRKWKITPWTLLRLVDTH